MAAVGRVEADGHNLVAPAGGNLVHPFAADEGLVEVEANVDAIKVGAARQHSYRRGDAVALRWRRGRDAQLLEVGVGDRLGGERKRDRVDRGRVVA